MEWQFSHVPLPCVPMPTLCLYLQYSFCIFLLGPADSAATKPHEMRNRSHSRESKHEGIIVNTVQYSEIKTWCVGLVVTSSGSCCMIKHSASPHASSATQPHTLCHKSCKILLDHFNDIECLAPADCWTFQVPAI